MGRVSEGAGVTKRTIHFLKPGDRVRARKDFYGAGGPIKAGRSGIVQTVVVELYLGDHQEVTAATIRWHGGRIENLQDHELQRWIVLKRTA